MKAVIIERSDRRPSWQPENLNEVTDDLVDRFFDPTSEYLRSAPKLEVPVVAEVPPPSQFALPTEAEIREVIVNSQTGDAPGLQLGELISRLVYSRQGKSGVKEKILEVVRRKCGLQDHADGDTAPLKWRDEEHPF